MAVQVPVVDEQAVQAPLLMRMFAQLEHEVAVPPLDHVPEAQALHSPLLKYCPALQEVADLTTQDVPLAVYPELQDTAVHVPVVLHEVQVPFAMYRPEQLEHEVAVPPKEYVPEAQALHEPLLRYWPVLQEVVPPVFSVFVHSPFVEQAVQVILLPTKRVEQDLHEVAEPPDEYVPDEQALQVPLLKYWPESQLTEDEDTATQPMLLPVYPLLQFDPVQVPFVVQLVQAPFATYRPEQLEHDVTEPPKEYVPEEQAKQPVLLPK